MDNQKLLSVKQLAIMLNLPASTIYFKLKERGQHAIPRVRLGKHYRFSPSDIEMWLNQQKNNSRIEA